MTVDMQRLMVSLEANTKKFENAMNRVNRDLDRKTKSIESKFAKLNARMGDSLGVVGRRWIAGLAAGVSVGALAKFSDAATRIDNALKVAGLSGADLEKVYGRLRDSAVKNAAPIEALVELYGRAALVQRELGITGEELLGFTDKIALALRVSGKSAAESSGALLQLSQALGSGTVRAEEFNSILEGALPIAQAAAAGLEEAGGSVAKLRQLVVDGEVSSQAFFRAFEAGSVILEQKVQGATLTFSQAVGNLNTALVDTAREFSNATGFGEKFAGAIDTAAQSISDFNVTGFIQKISEAGGALETFLNNVGNADIFKRLNEVLGTVDENGSAINLDAEAAKQEAAGLEKQVELLQDTIAKNTELGFDNTAALAQLDEVLARLAVVRGSIASIPATLPNPSAGDFELETGPSTRGGKRNVKVKTVSLANYAPPSGTKSGGGGGGGGGGQSDYQREVEQIKERTAALEAERAAMESVNPLVEDYGFAIEKARAKHELLAAAQKAGLAITPELEAQIDALATAYAMAGAEAEKLAEKQDKVREAADDFKSLGKDVLGGFIQDLKAGKTGAEALATALNKVADKLLDIALNALFDGGGGFGGIFSGIAKIFGFAGGGYTGNGGRNQPAGIVHRGEYVFSKAATQRIGVGNLEKLHRGYASGGLVAPSVSSALYNVSGPRPVAASRDVIDINLTDDSGRMAKIADRQIQTRSGTIVRVAVQQSQRATRANMPGFLAETQMRTM